VSEHGRLEALIDQTCSLLLHYHGLGNEVVADPQGWFVTNPRRPRLGDCNHLRAPRAGTPHEIEGLLERMEQRFAHLPHREVVCDPHTPPAFEATLVLRGFVATTEVKFVLSGRMRPAPAPPPGLDIRPVERDDDWAAVAELTRCARREAAGREQSPVGPQPAGQQVSDGLVEARLARRPAVRTWLAWVDGRAVGVGDALAGEHGLGLVTGLYTAPDHRRRGVASAVLRHAVAAVRAEGAGGVVLGAAPGGAARFVHGLGFEPLYVEHVYRREVGAPVGG